MKKWLGIFLALTLVLALAACGKSEQKSESKDTGADKAETTKLVVGASPVPHAEILEKAKPILKEKGIDLEIKTFTDYVFPNKALASKELDANYFQHVPYLNGQIKEFGYDFVNAGGIHIEPIGIYSKKYKKLEDLPKGAHIIMSNSVADHGRLLSLLEQNGLIKLKEGIDKTKAEIKDVVENPKNLKFDANYEAKLLPQIFNNGEGDAVLINSNYAIDAGLNPVKDSIAIEDKDSPYVNIIAVRKGDENKPAIKALVEVLQSKEIQDFILEKYKGAVVPAPTK
ncbi:MetQ/NlpA family ABC transporter substrate-binding protein [Neobacillus mesonae]|uniref:MetQ/NlpA family ABC transporter substrate-binding protein n=1 Tax=Neobacillus mesonae TaxID=1193713 RepID=UPI002041E911|nr:MetQ/NlpA family ABC transporter substrate-binding protein [Neobacillus mesonae]MCM3567536.1 MetQ/NlpA family ABC transporter substrate-binding protein [Neobacillus mesonae]